MQDRKNTDVLFDCLPMADQTVVDVGCGDGSVARQMVARGARLVLGLEVTERQVTRALAAPPDPRVMILKAGAQAMPLPDGSMDAVVFFNSLHHVPEELMTQALAEAARVLRPGGLVYVGEPIADGPFFTLLRPVDDETRVRALALARLREAAALGLIQIREEVYRNTVRLASFEALRERVGAANPERDARFAALESHLRAAYLALGDPDPDLPEGRHFPQPMRATLLRKEGDAHPS